MTYPPQPGQPGQSDPNQPGGYPQQGGFGQQGQPYGGQYQQQYPPTSGYEQPQYPPQGGYQQPQYPTQGGYQQQYPPNAQYGPGFGGPPAPPAKSKAGLVIGIVVAVVVIVALGVTGFVAPGFFLSKSSDKAASAPAASSAPVVPPAPGSGLPSTGDIDPAAKAEVEKFLGALNNKDADGAFGLRCADSIVTQDDITKAVAGTPGYKAASYNGLSGVAGVVGVVIEGADDIASGAMTVSKAPDGSGYCVSTLFLATP
jgi:hypothetical protein